MVTPEADKCEGKIPRILDCTIRDGGYINNWRFNKRTVREIFRALSKSGVDYVELGFRGSEKYFDPRKYGMFRFTNDDDLRDIVKGIDGPKIAVMGDYGKIDLDDFVCANESCIDMVRIATHKNNIVNALNLLDKIKEKGYRTSLQAMGFAAYNKKEKSDLISVIRGFNVDFCYIADSYGSIFPHDIEGLFEPFLELKNIKIGFHPHNNLQMAFANTLEAIRIGVDIIDSSIYGMGRGAGNLPTEVVLAYLQVRDNKKYNVVPVLNIIDRFFLQIMAQSPWGYQLPFMIAGMFNCHPYYASEMVKRREYSIDDVWRALEIVEEMKPIGFDPKILDSLIRRGVLGGDIEWEGKINDVVTRRFSPKKNHKVSYANRHQGRDFLVLANGPTLNDYSGKIHKFIDKFKPIVMGANFLSGLFEPNYHAFNNSRRFIEYVDDVSKKSALLVGENIDKKIIEEYTDRKYETLHFENKLNSKFDIKAGHVQTNCRTISVLLLGIAIVMGAKRLFAAGMDGYFDKNNIIRGLFYDEEFEPNDTNMYIERHKWNESFIGQIDRYLRKRGGEGLHILTPTSHQKYYKGIDNFLL